MIINKYKIITLNQDILIYTITDVLDIPLSDLNLELIQENVNLEENKFLPIFKAEDFLERIVYHTRTRDLVLSEQHIDTWNNLKAAYYAMRNRLIYFSKRTRDFITEKYSEIINNYDFNNTSFNLHNDNSI